jgi:hypothetical protein
MKGAGTHFVADVDRLAEAAFAWNWLRRLAVRLKKQRNDLSCDQDPLDQSFGMNPCWKRVFVQTSEDDGDYRYAKPLKEWCSKCLAREDVHRALLLVKPLRGIAMRRMEAIAKGLDHEAQRPDGR